jgi:hypothetical protein
MKIELFPDEAIRTLHWIRKEGNLTYKDVAEGFGYRCRPATGRVPGFSIGSEPSNPHGRILAKSTPASKLIEFVKAAEFRGRRTFVLPEFGKFQVWVQANHGEDLVQMLREAAGRYGIRVC